VSGPVQTFLAALRQRGYEPKPKGKGWCCRCPAHNDRTPSLTIDTGNDGRALVNCHAGCTIELIVGAIGLQTSQLFEPDPSRQSGHAPRTRPSVVASNPPRSPLRDAGVGEVKTYPKAGSAVAALEAKHGKRSAEWTYHNASGDPVGLMVRWDTPAGKDVRPVSRTANGSGWTIGGMPTPRPLYVLPELLVTPAGSRVYVTQGEKAADAARAVGLVATTSPHGSKSAGKADWSPMAGHEVVILPDNDDAGEQYADDVARLVTAAGAKSVQVVRLAELWDGMPKGGDMADLIAHRGGDVGSISAEVQALASKAELQAIAPGAIAVPAFTPFPVDVYPEPIRSFITDAAKAIGCDASFVALPLLSGLASAIGNTHRIALKGVWTEPAIVWTAIVGESGTAKSPALELALRPIRKRQAEAMKRHTKAMREYADALAMHERDANAWKRSKSNTPKPAEPEAPVADRCWTDDATTEALAVLLQQNPRGLLMVRDELAGWFNFDRYAGGKGGDAAKWLEMFGGRPMMVDRKTGGNVDVPRAAVSIAGGIQPETLRRALGQEHRDSGLAARLLLAYPPRKPKRWTKADVSEKAEAAVAAVFERLYALTLDTDDNGDERPRLVTLTDEAERAWESFYNEHNLEQVDLCGDLAAAWSKLEGCAARFALVIHLVRWAANDPTLRDPARVDAASIAAGVSLSRWFANEARRIYAMLSESDDDRKARQLVEWIERRGGVVTVRDVTHGIRAYRNDPDTAEHALSALVEAGIGRWESDDHGPKGGRPTRRFRLVSTVTVTETKGNPEADAGSGDGDAGDTTTDAGDGWGEL
jgi:hypothetical protein